MSTDGESITRVGTVQTNTIALRLKYVNVLPGMGMYCSKLDISRWLSHTVALKCFLKTDIQKNERMIFDVYI